jgi:hypothetical protein
MSSAVRYEEDEVLPTQRTAFASDPVAIGHPRIVLNWVARDVN